jgi:hypothetical protein
MGRSNRYFPIHAENGKRVQRRPATHGMKRQPELRPAYTLNPRPTVIAAEPAGLAFTVELHEAGEVRVLARAENVALARGAFDRAMKIWPDDEIRLCCGEAVLVRAGG